MPGSISTAIYHRYYRDLPALIWAAAAVALIALGGAAWLVRRRGTGGV